MPIDSLFQIAIKMKTEPKQGLFLLEQKALLLNTFFPVL